MTTGIRVAWLHMLVSPTTVQTRVDGSRLDNMVREGCSGISMRTYSEVELSKQSVGAGSTKHRAGSLLGLPFVTTGIRVAWLHMVVSPTTTVQARVDGSRLDNMVREGCSGISMRTYSEVELSKQSVGAGSTKHRAGSLLGLPFVTTGIRVAWLHMVVSPTTTAKSRSSGAERV
ncbi:hypothetical protein C8R43DRAFT_1153571 [Mycena crocata]|nr:hypothetical protein C8R43DRAFT_1153571 [Mycena crocata]